MTCPSAGSLPGGQSTLRVAFDRIAGMDLAKMILAMKRHRGASREWISAARVVHSAQQIRYRAWLDNVVAGMNDDLTSEREQSDLPGLGHQFLYTADDFEDLQSNFGPLLLFPEPDPAPVDYQMFLANARDHMPQHLTGETKTDWRKRADEIYDTGDRLLGDWRPAPEAGWPALPRHAKWFVLRQVCGLTYVEIVARETGSQPTPEERADTEDETGSQPTPGHRAETEEAIRKGVRRVAQAVGIRPRSVAAGQDNTPE